MLDVLAVTLTLITGQALPCDRAVFELGQVSCFQRCAIRADCPGEGFVVCEEGQSVHPTAIQRVDVETSR